MVDPVTVATVLGIGSVSAAGFASAGAIIGAIVINLGIAAILGKILAPNAPKTARDTKGLQNVVRSNIMPRRIIYGEAVTGGPYAVLETIGAENQWLNMIVVLAGHPIEDVLGIFINEEYIDISGNTNGSTNADSNDLSSSYYINKGKYGTGDAAQHVRIIKNLGWGYADKTYVTDETATIPINDRERGALINTIVSTPWTQGSSVRDGNTGLYDGEGYRLTNCAHIFVGIKYNRDIWSGFPKLKFHVKGKKLYNPAYDISKNLSAESPYNTHDIDDPDTFEYSEDWTLCILDYLLNPSYGLGAKIEPNILSEIHWPEMIQSYKDSSFQLNTFINEPNAPRYTINGVLETSNTPISNVESLLTSGGGELIYAQGKYKLRPAVYRAPENDGDIINEDMMVSPITIRTHTPRSELFNKAAGVYVDRGYTGIPSTFNRPKFEPSDFSIVDPLDSSGLNPYEEIDEEEIIKEFDFPFTTREYEAQRLARIQLERVRQGLTISFEANLSVLKFSVGDNVYLEILSNSKYANESFFNRLGLDATVQLKPDFPAEPYYKQFKIVDMQYTENSTINVLLLEESQEIYDWNENMANKVDHALISEIIAEDPDGPVLPPSFIVGGGAVTEILSTTPGTSLTTLIRWNAVAGTGLDQAYISFYRLEYGIVDNPGAPLPEDRVDTWIVAGNKASDHSTLIQGPLALETLYKDGAIYDFRVQAVTYSGRASVWTYYSEDIGTYYSPTPAPSSAGTTIYYIKPITGTAIKNHIGTLTLEAHAIIAGEDSIISSGNRQLYVNGSTLVHESNGFQLGSDGYTGIFNHVNINNSVVVELREGADGNILDSITLVDVEDGASAAEGEDAVYGYIEATSGLAWTQAINEGAWTPATTFTNLDVTFVKGGAEVARWSTRIDLDESSGILTNGGAATHASGNFNTGRITRSISGNSTQALTVKYDYLNSPDISSVAETVITSRSGTDGSPGSAALNIGRACDNLERWYRTETQSSFLSANPDFSVENVISPVAIKGFRLVDNNNDSDNLYSERIAIDTSKKYKLSLYAQQPSGDRPNYFLVAFFDSAGDNIRGNVESDATGWTSKGTFHYWTIANSILSSSWTNYTYEFGGDATATIPTGAATFCIGALLSRTGTTETTIELQDYHVIERALDGEDGLDGSDGSDGSDGISARAVNLTAGQQTFVYKSDDTLNDNPNTTMTAIALNTVGTPYFEFFLNDGSVQDTTSNTWTYTPQADYNDMPDKVEVHITEDSTGGTIYARDQLTVLGVKPGVDAPLVVQSNEAHTLPTNNVGTVDYVNSGNTISVYIGATKIAYDDTAPYASPSFRITDASGTDITPDPTPTEFSNYITYGPASAMSEDTAIITYTIVVKNNEGIETTLVRVQSFAKSIGGADGKVGWGHDIVFSSTDSDTVAWSSGTIWLAGFGGPFSINSGNTGNMTSGLTYYIYLDSDVSSTVLQTTTTAQNSVGNNRILVCVAEMSPIADQAFFQVFGGKGGLLVTADQIAANSIVTNNLTAGSVTADELSVSKLVSADDLTEIFGQTTTGTRLEIEGSHTYPLWFGTGATKNEANAKFFVKSDGTIKYLGSSSSDSISGYNAHLRSMYPLYTLKTYDEDLSDLINGPTEFVGGQDCNAIAVANSELINSFSTNVSSTYSWPIGFGLGSLTFFHPTETSLSAGIASQRLANDSTPIFINGCVQAGGLNSNIKLQYRYDGGTWTTLQTLYTSGSSFAADHTFSKIWFPGHGSWNDRIDFRFLLTETGGVQRWWSFQMSLIGFNITRGYGS
jgi:hypothetical protein